MRVRFSSDIVAEIFPAKKYSQKVIIFASGMPTMPAAKKKLAKFFTKRGYWFIAPRYRGTWESGGNFLEYEPTEDIRDIVEELAKPLSVIGTADETLQIDNPQIFVIGSSFGGTAALLISDHPLVKKVVSISGVVDWNDEGQDEPINWLFETLLPEAFGNGYRFQSTADWKKLVENNFYSPIAHEFFDKNKILLIHSIDDTVVPYSSIKKFSRIHTIPLITIKNSGHVGSSIIRKWYVWRRIKKHLK